ncbi:hypothetical protein [Methylobacterium sp. Leaf118]|uniref:hypothetical protein n=1 Tax=Methylobacterium sp. Leaf118 TaxID=2876562 RepID=UPI001E517C43|nr:hypothetical protein [Methylobacterium sp. Leaf118]
MRRFAISWLAAGLFSIWVSPASAGPRQPFETVKGWQVERVVGDTSADSCLMTHVYEDEDDNNATNAIVFALDGNKAVLALVYQGWSYDKDETRTVPLYLDKKLIKAKSQWVGDGKVLTAQLPDSIVPDLLAAKRIILRFEDGDADFNIPHFAAGYESLRRCSAAPKPGVAAAPALPSKERIAAYIMGLTLQTAVADCEVSTTGKQRAALEARMAALKPEMAPIEDRLRAEAKKASIGCPKAAEEAEFKEALTLFVDLGPDEFAAAMDKASAARAASAAPKP